MEKEENIWSVILFGSRARGDHKENSDYDLMFITKSSIKNFDEEFIIKQKYKNKIAERTKLDKNQLQISLWSLDDFKKEHEKGNSFIYCALRDGKFLFSREKINLKQPTNCTKAALDRLYFVKRNIEHIKFYLKHLGGSPSSNELENLGYSSMHLCWAVCMLNNHFPLSKYTILKECRKYFNLEEFENIKKTYQLYVNSDGKEIDKKTFLGLFNSIKKVTKRIEEEYEIKDKKIQKNSMENINEGN